MSAGGMKPSDEGATDFMDLEQVARYLGIEESVVLQQVEQGKMPAIRFGETWRFSRAGLMAWAVEAGFRNLS
jgi:excisionase family DNA binding protein